MKIRTLVKGYFSFHSFYFSLLFSFLIIYQREQPLSLFKRIKIFHLKGEPGVINVKFIRFPTIILMHPLICSVNLHSDVIPSLSLRCSPFSNQCEMQSENGIKDTAIAMQLTNGE